MENKVNIYALVDRKANAICAVFTSLSDETAVRSFEDMLFRIEDNLYNQNPQDFCVVSCGGIFYSTANGLKNFNENFNTVVADGSSYSKALIDSKRIERAEFYSKLEAIKRGERDGSK